MLKIQLSSELQDKDGEVRKDSDDKFDVTLDGLGQVRVDIKPNNNGDYDVSYVVKHQVNITLM